MAPVVVLLVETPCASQCIPAAAFPLAQRRHRVPTLLALVGLATSSATPVHCHPLRFLPSVPQRLFSHLTRKEK